MLWGSRRGANCRCGERGQTNWLRMSDQEKARSEKGAPLGNGGNENWIALITADSQTILGLAGAFGVLRHQWCLTPAAIRRIIAASLSKRCCVDMADVASHPIVFRSIACSSSVRRSRKFFCSVGAATGSSGGLAISGPRGACERLLRLRAGFRLICAPVAPFPCTQRFACKLPQLQRLGVAG